MGNISSEGTRGTMTPIICTECEQFVRCPSCDDWICWNCGADLGATENIPFADVPEDVTREEGGETHDS